MSRTGKEEAGGKGAFQGITPGDAIRIVPILRRFAMKQMNGSTKGEVAEGGGGGGGGGRGLLRSKQAIFNVI